MAILRIERGPGAGNTYVIDSDVSLGRDPSQATIHIPDTKVSSKHALILQKNNTYYVEDNKSKNHTYLNGRPITEQTQLESGDYISLGHTWIYFEEEHEIERIGQELAGYEIIQRIEQGGAGHHFKVRQVGLDRIVNLYLLPPNIIRANPHLKKKFRLQAKALAKLNHENIAIMLDFEAKESCLFLTTEYVEGETLADISLSNPPASRGKKKNVPLDRALEIGRGIAQGLAHAHSQGTIHQDINPDNIMICGPRVILGGFGVAAVFLDSKDKFSGLIGKTEYISPEQITRKEVDYRSDIYSLGVILYELLSGQAPFYGDNPEEIMEAHLNDSPPALTSFNPDIPAELEKLVYQCLEKEKENRPQDMELLASTLDSILLKEKALNLKKTQDIYTSPLKYYIVKVLNTSFFSWLFLPILSVLLVTIFTFCR